MKIASRTQQIFTSHNGHAPIMEASNPSRNIAPFLLAISSDGVVDLFPSDNRENMCAVVIYRLWLDRDHSIQIYVSYERKQHFKVSRFQNIMHWLSAMSRAGHYERISCNADDSEIYKQSATNKRISTTRFWTTIFECQNDEQLTAWLQKVGCYRKVTWVLIPLS